MGEEEKLELAKKVAPSTILSIEEVINIINEIIIVQNSELKIKFEIDEEYVQRVIWVKTISGRI